MEQPDLKKYAQDTVAKAVRENDPDEKPEECLEYEEECDPKRKVEAIRALIDNPHDDDSPCEDSVWMAVDSVLNDVLNGIEAALDLE